MSNADYFNGTGLNGDPSSTSSGLIVPHPTNPDLYFVFTIDEPHHENANAYPKRGPANSNGNSIPLYTDTNQGVPETDDGFNNGLNYSIVDLSLDGGLGNVIPSERNNELITYDLSDSEQIKYKASEKITAVRGQDCNSVWVITHFRNKFYTFFIDQAGIDETPVISKAPPLLEVDNYRRAALGYLKASPLGDKLLIAHNTTNFDQSGTQDAGDGNVYAYAFDNSSGEISNPVELIAGVNAYGVEFSQDGTKAYATVNDFSPKIYQWDLNSSNVPNSIELVANINQTTALQLGPDGKIYHSLINTSTLGVINNPNELGTASNYTQSTSQGAISLNGRFATFGLPPFIQSLFSKRIPIVDTPTNEVIEQVSLCDMASYTLSYDNISGASYVWKKDGTILPGETDYFLVISIPTNSNFPLQENYSLEVDLNNGDCPLIGVARVNFNKSPAYKDTELIACKEPQENFAIFDLTEIKSSLAEDAQVNPDEMNLIFYKNFEDADQDSNRIPSTSSFINSEELESLFAKVTTFGVCTSIIEVELTIQEFPDVNLDDELIIYCLEDSPNPIVMDALNGNQNSSKYEFSWTTGEISQTLNINQAGLYSVEIKEPNSNCSAYKTFEVIESNIADFVVNVEDSSRDNKSIEITLNPSSLGIYEYALNEPLNFQEPNRFENLNPGIYIVYVRDQLGCGISQKTVSVLGIMEFFTPNGDGINDVWKISGLSGTNQENIQMEVYDRYGKLLSSFNSKDQGWDGTYNGKNMATDDYWFHIQFSDGRVETGHFTLKR
jgi:gliding motility-associated-like protein